MKALAIVVLALLGGCIWKENNFDRENVTQVQLSRSNYKVVGTAEGVDTGVRVFGVFGSDPSYAEVMGEVRKKAELQGKPRALVNATSDEVDSCWLLVTIKRLRVTCDVIEFLPDASR